MSPQATGLAHSVQVRLKNEAQRAGRPFAELLELYAVERFLHRLGRSSHRDRYVLKGALLLRQWLGVETRPTRDIDLLGPVDLDEAELHDFLIDVLELDVEDDGIAYDLASITIERIRIGSSVRGLRAKFDGRLGQVELRYQVDVGLGDAIYPEAVEIVPGGLLGMPMASVRAYTPYSTVAEKLEAMVVLGEANSRIKDYFDLLHLSRELPFDGATLVESIRRTFSRRGTTIPEEPLEGLSDTFANDQLHGSLWRGLLTKNQLGASDSLAMTVAAVRAFAQPAIDAARDGQAFAMHWPAGGLWEPAA